MTISVIWSVVDFEKKLLLKNVYSIKTLCDCSRDKKSIECECDFRGWLHLWRKESKIHSCLVQKVISKSTADYWSKQSAIEL